MSEFRDVERLPDPAGSHDTGDRLIGEAVGVVGKDWLREARMFAIRVANRGREFSCNDIWQAGLSHPGGVAGRALGAVMQELRRDGFIRKTDRVVRSVKGTAYIDVWIKA